MSAIPLWLVTTHGPGLIGNQDATYVHAASAAEAATEGAELLNEALDEEDSRIETVHVVAVIERAAFDIGWEASASKSALQCCGGGGAKDGHSGWCPEVRR